MNGSLNQPWVWAFLGVVGLAGLLLAWQLHEGNGDERATAEEERQQELADAPDWYVEGEAVYRDQCAACHAPDGQGSGRNFPPLADHVVELLEVEGGREYLIDVTLYGIGGEIRVLGETYRGQMPGFGRLSDDQVADMLNYLAHAWGHDEAVGEDFERYRPDEVGERRDRGLAPRQVRDYRPELHADE